MCKSFYAENVQSIIVPCRVEHHHMWSHSEIIWGTLKNGKYNMDKIDSIINEGKQDAEMPNMNPSTHIMCVRWL